MKRVWKKLIDLSNWYDTDRLERQLKDYIDVTSKLIWQRQAIFLSITLLTAYYFDPAKAWACYGGVLFTEVLDQLLVPRVRKWKDRSTAKARYFLLQIGFNTVLSASMIGLFVVMIALQQPTGGHFMPLFVLFAAGLFAAMNNHQLLPILILRLTIYGGTFLFISMLDVFRYFPPLTSHVWLEFFTTVFVLYFIVDVSIQFLLLYRQNMRRLEELKIEHQRTKAAYEVKSQFLSTVSHELRTPLTSIKGSLDLVTTGALGPVPEKMKPVLEIAGKNSKRLANLINDLLDLQKIEAGEMSFKFEPLSVRKLLEEAADASRGYADSLRVNLTTRLPEDEIFIRGDETRMMQVMANLISNAVKFSKEGGVVEIYADKQASKARISVKDNGIGIPENAKEQVFGQFSQVDSSDCRKVGGTGLGMNISRRIVERHKGTIDYESVVGKGSTFFIEMGLADKPAGGLIA
jgi:signal transduction histidine kinase